MNIKGKIYVNYNETRWEVCNYQRQNKSPFIGMTGEQVKLGFEAPYEISILREEILLREGESKSDN